MATKIVSDDNAAVLISQVAAVQKSGVSDFKSCLNIYFATSSTPVPLLFDKEADRDAFFKLVVTAMGG